MTKLSDIRPVGGGGGGSGSGIKGTWDVTPTYTPPSYTLPDFVQPVLPQANYSSFSVVGDTATVVPDFGSNATASPEVKVASAILDYKVDFPVDTVKSYRFQLGFGTLPNINDPVIGIPFFGFIDESIATSNSSINAFLESLILETYSGSDYFSVVLFFSDGSIVSPVFHYQGAAPYASGDTAQNQLVAMTSSNTVDIYSAYFNGAIIGQSGDTFVTMGTIVNSTVGGSQQGNVPFFPVTGVTKKLVPVFGTISFDQVGSGTHVNLAVSADFTAAHTQVEVGHFVSLGAPQNVFDGIFGNPVSAVGNNIPASYTQVSTFPSGAAVDDLYITTISNSYAGDLSEVKPMNKWVREDEIIRVVSLSPNSFDVFNEWRDSGGEVTVENVNLSLTLSAISNVVASTDINGNTVVSGEPSNISSSAFLGTVNQFIYSAPNDDIQKNEGVGVNDRFRIEFGHKPFVGTSAFRQSLSVVTSVGSREAIMTSFTDGVHGIDTTAGGSLLSTSQPYSAFFVLDSSNVFPAYKTVITGFSIDVSCSNGSAALAVGDYCDSFSGRVVSVDGNNLPTRISITNSYTISLSSLQSFIGNTLFFNGNSVSCTLDSIVNVVIQFSEPATASGPTTIYYDKYSGAFSSTMAYSHFGKNGLDGINSYADIQSMSTHGALFNSKDAFKTSIQRLYNINAFQEVAGTYLHLTIPGDRSGYGYILGLVLPRLGILSPIDPTSQVAMEWDFTDKSLTLRFKTLDAQEHFITIDSAYIQANATVESEVLYGTTSDLEGTLPQITGDGFTTVHSTGQPFYPTGAFTALYEKNLVTNEIVKLTQGVEYTVTAQGEITFATPLTSEEAFGGTFVYGTSGVCLFPGSGTPSPSANDAAELFDKLIDSFVDSTKFSMLFNSAQVHSDFVFNFGYGNSWERPNPDGYAPYVQKLIVRSQALGNLFIVDEVFDPTFQLEMKYKVKGALAIVNKSAMFRGKYFIQGNYARWDGSRTVPFPDTALTPTYMGYPLNTIDLPSGISEYVFVVENDKINRVNLVNFSGYPSIYLEGNVTGFGMMTTGWYMLAFKGSSSSTTVSCNGIYDSTGNAVYSMNFINGKPYRFTILDGKTWVE